jgi:MFS superfamily sulfate permease-like transporter
MKRYWRVRKEDFWLAMSALVGVLLFDALIGLVVAVLLSLVAMVWRAATPKVSTMGRALGRPGYVSVEHEPDAEQLDGVLLLRVDENLFFANAGGIRAHVVSLVVDAELPVQTVVLDLEATNWPDIPACDELLELRVGLRTAGVTLSLARVHRSVYELFDRAGVIDAVGEEHIFDRVIDAVAEHLGRTHRAIDVERVAEIASAMLQSLADRLDSDDPTRARLDRAVELLEQPADDTPD